MSELVWKALPLAAFPGRLERQRKVIREPAQHVPRQRLMMTVAQARTLRGFPCWPPDRVPLTLHPSGEGRCMMSAAGADIT